MSHSEQQKSSFSRRAVVLGLGVSGALGFSGCLGGSEGSSTPTETATDEPTTPNGGGATPTEKTTEEPKSYQEFGSIEAGNEYNVAVSPLHLEDRGHLQNEVFRTTEDAKKLAGVPFQIYGIGEVVDTLGKDSREVEKLNEAAGTQTPGQGFVDGTTYADTDEEVVVSAKDFVGVISPPLDHLK